MLAIGVVSASAALVAVGPAGVAGATSSHAKTIKVSTAKIANVGTVLTTANGLTLYRFTQDTTGTATCTGVCAKIWPPLLASKGAHISGPKGVKGLSLINVGNGHFQVAFHKVALYRYASDKKKGQAQGQSFEGKWFAVLKSGIPASATAGAVAPAPAPTPTATPPAGATTQPTMQTTPTTQTHSSTGSNTTAPTQAPTPPPSPTTTPPTSPPPTTTPTTQAPAPPTGGTGF